MTRKNSKPHTRKTAKKAELEKFGIASTLKAAASMTGLPMHRILAAKAAGCKSFRANGRIDCDSLMDFVATMPAIEGEIVDYQLEKALDVRANRMLKTQKLEERSKQLRKISDIRREWFANTIACKTKLYTAENSIAVEVGLTMSLNSNQIAILRGIISKHIQAAIKELHAGDLGKVECPECKKEIAHE